MSNLKSVPNAFVLRRVLTNGELSQAILAAPVDGLPFYWSAQDHNWEIVIPPGEALMVCAPSSQRVTLRQLGIGPSDGGGAFPTPPLTLREATIKALVERDKQVRAEERAACAALCAAQEIRLLDDSESEQSGGALDCLELIRARKDDASAELIALRELAVAAQKVVDHFQVVAGEGVRPLDLLAQRLQAVSRF